MPKIVVGCDPGKAGALSFFTDGSLSGVALMPLYETPQGEVMVDGKGVFKLLDAWSSSYDLIVVERQHPRPFDAKKSVFTLGRGYAALETAIRLLEVPSDWPQPQEWQKSLLKGALKKGKTKAAALGFVKSKFPKFDLSPYKGDSLTGVCDSICIGYYGVVNAVK